MAEKKHRGRAAGGREGPEEKISVEHRASPQFISDYADGVIMLGPLPGGMSHLIFYREAMEVPSETGIYQESGDEAASYTLSVDKPLQFREDLARITLPNQGAEQLLLMLIKKYPEKALDWAQQVHDSESDQD